MRRWQSIFGAVSIAWLLFTAGYFLLHLPRAYDCFLIFGVLPVPIAYTLLLLTRRVIARRVAH